MSAYAALLRAVNVGGTGTLPMNDLRRLCERCGFDDVATYIQSGNVVFRSPKNEASVKTALERLLAERMGKPFGVMVRTAAELRRTIEANPFPHAPPNRLLVFFLDAPPPEASIRAVVPPAREELALRGREIFVHYPDGMGKSKLKVPLRDEGTGRNLNTVRKLAEMATALE